MSAKFCFTLMVAGLLAAPLFAQPIPTNDENSSKETAKPARARSSLKAAREDRDRDDKVAGFTLEREAAALSFVEQHHVELGELLAKLEKSNRRGYQQAINELFRTSERLATTKEKDHPRYEFELRIWKLDSRLRLLAARMSMSASPELQDEIKSLLLEKADVQIEQKLFERQRLANRLEKLDATIERARQQRESKAQESLDVLLRDIKRWQPANRPPRSGALPARPAPGSLDATSANTAHR